MNYSKYAVSFETVFAPQSISSGGFIFKPLIKLKRDHCIIRHSLRYYRHSGLVIYMSKLPAPSVSMPCDYRILQSPTKGQVKLIL